MKRLLIRSSAFLRDAKRLAKKDPQVVESFLAALAALQDDPFQPQLKTHKLKGDLQGSWACGFGRGMRVVFEFVSTDQGEAILLESVGTHEEVY